MYYLLQTLWTYLIIKLFQKFKNKKLISLSLYHLKAVQSNTGFKGEITHLSKTVLSKEYWCSNEKVS